MNTLKNITKKAVAVGASAAILATTIAGAAALDLKDYPAPFVKDGQFNGLIVVGEKAATSDVLGSIEIASSLQAASTTVVSNSGSSTAVSGDAKKIGSAGNLLEVGEYIGSATQTLTESDLAFLKGGSVSTNSGDTDFIQTLRLDATTIGITNAESGKVLLKKNDDGKTGEFLFFANGQPLFQYTLEFTSGFTSTVSSGTATDLEDESLFILGQYFNVVRATAAANTITLNLIAGDVTDTLKEGETKTYTVDGKSYEVTVLFVSDAGTPSAKFLINGQATKSLGKGDTDKVGGIDFGVRDVLSQSRGTTGGTLVEFYLGANKLEISDSDVTSSSTHGTIKVNGETVDQATIDIAGTASTTAARVNKITYTLKTDAKTGANVYLEKGQGMRDMLRKPEAMLAQKWDIKYMGMSAPATTPITIESAGDDQYDIAFTNVRGDNFRAPFFHALSASTWKMGDDTYNFVTMEKDGGAAGVADQAGDFPIGISDYFVVTGRTGTSTPKDTDESYVLRFNSVNTADKTVRFTMPGPGTEVTATYTLGTNHAAATPDTGSVTIGGKDYKFWLTNTAADASGTWTLAVDLDGSGALVDGKNTEVVVKGGAVLSLGNFSNTTANGVTAGSSLNMSLYQAAKNVDSNVDITEAWTLAAAAGTQVSMTVPAQVVTYTPYFATRSISGADQTVGIDQYGAVFTYDNPTNSPESLRVDYPAEQVEALVYVIGGDVQTSTVAGGQGVRVNPIKVGSAVLDKDVRKDQANMIVVGGPCVNTVAADLLGNPKDCAEGFTAGQGMIKMFDTGDNVAVLVAGYGAQDTQGASRVLAQYADYKLAGESATVTVTSLTKSGIIVK